MGPIQEKILLHGSQNILLIKGITNAVNITEIPTANGERQIIFSCQFNNHSCLLVRDNSQNGVFQTEECNWELRTDQSFKNCAGCPRSR